MNVSGVSSVASSSAMMASLLQNAQSASTALAEKMIQISAADKAAYAEMTGVGQVLDLYC